nr:MAG TPA: hypothetical protein [Caudoviricetes sp.]
MTVNGEPCVFVAVRPSKDDLTVFCGEGRQCRQCVCERT